jgi:hypothetical protein
VTENDLFDEMQLVWRAAISGELLRIEEICCRAALSQAEGAQIWRAVNLWMGSAAVLTAGAAGSVVLATSRFPVLVGSLALTAALLTAIFAMIGPGRREARAAESAKAYQSVQTQARQARQVDLARQTFEQARENLVTLTTRWQGVDQCAIPVLRPARRRAERSTYTEQVEEALQEKMSEVVNVFQIAQA